MAIAPFPIDPMLKPVEKDVHAHAEQSGDWLIPIRNRIGAVELILALSLLFFRTTRKPTAMSDRSQLTAVKLLHKSTVFFGKLPCTHFIDCQKH
ncbi:hypothetical protein D9M69_690620 [compost metagenome]